MNRRSFIKHGALWVPPLFAIGRARGAVLTLADPAMVGRSRPAGSSSPTLQDSYEWQTTTYSVNMSANYYNSATDWYPTVSFTLSELRIYCEKVGTPTMTATPYVYSDSSGSPGSSLTGGTGTAFALSGCPAAGSPASFSISGFSCAISSGTRYWLVLNFGGSYSNTNTVKIYCALKADAAYHAKKSDSPPAWNNDAYQTAMGWQAYGT